MSGVFYFPRYSQRENFNTNNALLLMYRLYDWNRHRFQKFLAGLLEETETPPPDVGLQIRQQVGTRESVLDGHLFQPSIRIAVEAKGPGAAFGMNQLERHLSGFDAGGGYLLLLSPQREDLNENRWNDLRALTTKRNVILASVTFEDVIRSVRSCLQDHDSEMKALVEDFEAYCSEEKLLDTDSSTVFVPPCGHSLEINRANRLYFCPSHWSRRKVRYIGIYSRKSVQLIGTISKVVYPEIIDGELIARDDKGIEITLPDEKRQRITASIHAAREQHGWDLSFDHKFYLSDDLRETDFKKVSVGGIQGHRYINLKGYFDPLPASLEQLANQLRTQSWE